MIGRPALPNDLEIAYVIKAREAMLGAVGAFNNTVSSFRAEQFIVTSMIAWTSLIFALLTREEVLFTSKKKNGVTRTKSLSECLNNPRIKELLKDSVRTNLFILIAIRGKVVHDPRGSIEQQISGKLQACCLNFNDILVEHYGSHLSLSHVLPLALQFSPLLSQTVSTAPSNTALQQFIAEFEERLDDTVLGSKAYSFRVKMVRVKNERGEDTSGDFAVINPDQAVSTDKVIQMIDVEPNKYLPSEVVAEMVKQGFVKFRTHEHTQLWKKVDAKDLSKNFGTEISGKWYWYDSWLKRVEQHCSEVYGKP